MNYLRFEEETVDEAVGIQKKPWRILVSDDEEQVHAMTRMVMRKFEFEGRGVEILSAYSGEETKEMMAQNRDIAILFLDVVMEEEDTGLKVVRYVRETLENPLVRIILRTGQPGQAPEEEVIRHYDINDYKSKTELTVKKLYTSVIASLRAYQDMMTIEKNKIGLERILQSARTLFRLQSIETFAENVLHRLDDLTSPGGEGPGRGLLLTGKAPTLAVVATNEAFRHFEGLQLGQLPVDLQRRFSAFGERETLAFHGTHLIGRFDSMGGLTTYLYYETKEPLGLVEQDLMRIFHSNIAVAIDNLYLNEEIIDTQKEVIITLGEIVETRSKETANHVRRVAEYSYLMAKAYGIDDEQATLLRLASPMHDIGKIGIPDVILNKPGPLTKEEFEIIKTHASIGYEVLKKSNRDILRAAATIAAEHHERWNGKGYPKGLAGEEIHIFARITAICDVYDALSHKRVYKEAWPEAEVLANLREESGEMFDPQIVALFFEEYPAIRAIKDRYPNKGEE